MGLYLIDTLSPSHRFAKLSPTVVGGTVWDRCSIQSRVGFRTILVNGTVVLSFIELTHPMASVRSAGASGKCEPWREPPGHHRHFYRLTTTP